MKLEDIPQDSCSATIPMRETRRKDLRMKLNVQLENMDFRKFRFWDDLGAQGSGFCLHNVGTDQAVYIDGQYNIRRRRNYMVASGTDHAVWRDSADNNVKTVRYSGSGTCSGVEVWVTI